MGWTKAGGQRGGLHWVPEAALHLELKEGVQITTKTEAIGVMVLGADLF